MYKIKNDTVLFIVKIFLLCGRYEENELHIIEGKTKSRKNILGKSGCSYMGNIGNIVYF
jgi:hypothetical protein